MIWLMMIGEMRGMVHVERGGVVSWRGPGDAIGS